MGYKEVHFEEAIEAHLLTRGGWTKGDPAEFRRDLGLIPGDFFAFVQDTQPQLWEELRKQHGSGLDEALLDSLTKSLESRGTLDVLRHDFKVLGRTVEAACFQPAHGLNPDILVKYQKNRLMLTRQVKFIPEQDESVDMVLFLNGLPVATVELKNPLTGQNVEHAMRQYERRDPKHPLFHFKKRALVHFAVDPDLVYMTTKLAGKETVFLPFNRGCNGGKGNPPHPSGYKTAYLWEEVWQRDSFLDILARFVHLAIEEKKVDGKTKTTESMIFPRYHQLDVVRQLVVATRATREGQSFLVQHSAGSGKSNSIAWLAHRLSSLHGKDDKKSFDSVVVVTDRTVLDKQLQDTIYQFEHKQGVVACIDESSSQLAEELKKGTPIVITTLQKFPFVTEKVGQLPDRRYAVIVDEAHSSQTGEAARQMKEVLAARSLEIAAQEESQEEETWEDRIAQVMASRGRQKNLCFFAFTATPKYKTLEIFGKEGPDGKPAPFHLYSMRQAIEERFILDVLENYTTYKRYYRLVKACEEDPRVPAKQAKSQLARFIEIHPHNLAQKTEVIVEHYRQKIRHKINGRAKAMVVTGSRLHAVRYKQAFDKYLAEKGYDIGVLVAFSGTVKDPDVSSIEYTEVAMNKGIKEKELPEKFDTSEYNLLIAANKYQTGFDQPLLHTMYVDKRLSGVQAVQALSRLNRTHPGKSETFVLDFVNDPDEIRRSFQPYYEQTTVAESAEPQQLYDLQHNLDAAQVYFLSEVESFARVFFKPTSKQTAQDQAELYRYLNPAVDRFSALDEEKQGTFRNQLGAFVRLYAFLSQVMPFTDLDLEMRYAFCRFLEMKLPHDERRGGLLLGDEVALAYYRLDKISEGTIDLQTHKGGGLYGPTEVGSRAAREHEVALSEIIDILNEKFGTHFTTSDQISVFDAIRAEAKSDDEVVQQAFANPFDNFALAFRPKVEGLMLDRMERNQDIVTRYLNDPEFRAIVDQELARRTYDEIRGSENTPA